MNEPEIRTNRREIVRKSKLDQGTEEGGERMEEENADKWRAGRVSVR